MTGKLLEIAEYGEQHATAVAASSPAHGPRHWRDVARIGYRVGMDEGADLRVVYAFAALHDTQRLSEFSDPEHGDRAADLLQHDSWGLDERQMRTLRHALVYHDTGAVEDFDATIGACWDADRLTLPRVGIEPDREFFSTRVVQDAFAAWTERALEIMRGDDLAWEVIAGEYEDATAE